MYFVAEMDAELLQKYDLRVPRYTSYPTAPHFGPRVDGDRYAGWLGALAPDAPLSLYVHIPFCRQLCWFCGCNTRAVNRYTPVAHYIDLLKVEIGRVADALGPGRPVRHLHWGGGTPTILRGADFLDLMAFLRDRFAFAADAEIAVEIDPRVTTRETVAGLTEGGTTRASIGVQDFDPAVQAAINRFQSAETTAEVAGWLRADGIRDLNLDLLYGLPRQTAAGVARTMERALELTPARVALFGYAHVPWMKSHQALIDAATLPDAGQRLAQFDAAERVLTKAGYVAIGLDHFAAPDDSMARALADGRLRRNFQGYTTDDAPVLIGFGASAIGQLPQGYVQNAPDVPAWRAALRRGALPVARGIALDADDRLRAEVIEALMCAGAADLNAICARHGRPATWLDAELASLAPLVADGIAEIDGATVRVTDFGRPLLRAVCAAFDAYLAPEETRHATAV